MFVDTCTMPGTGQGLTTWHYFVIPSFNKYPTNANNILGPGDPVVNKQGKRKLTLSSWGLCSKYRRGDREKCMETNIYIFFFFK